MTRGPQITKGLALAIPFALRRGHVMVFMAALLNLAEFLITGNGLFVLVRVRFARKIRSDIKAIEIEFAEAIAGLRLVPRSGPVSCELWLYNRYGSLRHFRIEDKRIVEIDCCGGPFVPAKPATVPASASGNPGILPGSAETTAPCTAASVIDPQSPIYRYLRKWNAAREAGKDTGSIGSNELRKILDAGEPGGLPKKNVGKKPGKKKSKVIVPDDPETGHAPEAPAPGKRPVVAGIPELFRGTGYPDDISSPGESPGILEDAGSGSSSDGGTGKEGI